MDVVGSFVSQPAHEIRQQVMVSGIAGEVQIAIARL